MVARSKLFVISLSIDSTCADDFTDQCDPKEAEKNYWLTVIRMLCPILGVSMRNADNPIVNIGTDVISMLKRYESSCPTNKSQPSVCPSAWS